MIIDEEKLNEQQDEIIRICKNFKRMVIVEATGLDENKVWRILSGKVENPSWIDLEKIRLFLKSQTQE